MDKERDPRTENEDLEKTSEERVTDASDEDEFEDIDEVDEVEDDEEDVEA